MRTAAVLVGVVMALGAGGDARSESGCVEPASHDPAFSPDGRQIAVVVDDGCHFYGDLYVAGVHGGPRLRAHGFFVTPAWSPSGEIAVQSSANGEGESEVVEVVAPDGARTVVGPGQEPAWSPGGKLLAYAEGRTIRIWDGVRSRAFASGGLAGWSPDGSLLAVANDALVVRSVATGHVTVRVEGLEPFEEPLWSPDGKRIAYAADDGPKVVEVATGRKRAPRIAANPVGWLGDSRHLLFQRGKVLDVVTGRVSAPFPQDEFPVGVSRDGGRLALLLPAGRIGSRATDLYVSDRRGLNPHLVSPHRPGTYGTDRGDRLGGTIVYGLAGDDRLSVPGDADGHLDGAWGNDVLLGGAGDDLLRGGPGDDTLQSGGGADDLDGGPGADTISATGLAPTRIWGGTGRDRIRGGPEPDVVTVWHDGRGDVVWCGAGRDTVYADRGDRVYGCELVVRAQ